MTDFEVAMMARSAAQGNQRAKAWLREYDERERLTEDQSRWKRMVVYLAGHHMADDYRTQATKILMAKGIRVLDPMRDEHDYRGIEGDNVERIVQGDLRDVVDCTHVLADFSQNSVGTSMECWFAHSIGRPVVSFVESKDLRISPWVHYVSRSVHIGVDLALVYLCA